MFSTFRVIAFVFIAAFATTSAREDYFDVTATANVRKHPLSSSQLLPCPAIGNHLSLRDGGMRQNGSYHIIEPTTQLPGWIYHRRVQLRSGDIPGTTAGTPPIIPPDTGDVMTAHYITMERGAATLLAFSCGAVLISA